MLGIICGGRGSFAVLFLGFQLLWGILYLPGPETRRSNPIFLLTRWTNEPSVSPDAPSGKAKYNPKPGIEPGTTAARSTTEPLDDAFSVSEKKPLGHFVS